MAKQIVILDGHPDLRRERFCHALANTYAEGAASAGHRVVRINIAELDIPFVRSADEWDGDDLSPMLRQAQRAIAAADHVVIIYPLWLGTMPAMLKAFLEQITRGGFAVKASSESGWPSGQLKGKSARIIVTMGMPAFLYRWYFLAHSLRNLERNILAFAGMGPIRDTLIGRVDALGGSGRERWLHRIRTLGQGPQ